MHGQGRDPSAEVRARLREQMAAIEARGRAGGAGQPGADAGADAAEDAFRKIERLACMREQSSSALRSRLVREGFPEGAACAAVERAVACGLVDDRRYADVLVRSRLAQGRGRRGIEAELAAVGIDAEEAARLVGEAAGASGAGDGQDEIERALELLERRPPHAKNLRQAAYRRLVQKGYGSSVAASAARLWCEQQEAGSR